MTKRYNMLGSGFAAEFFKDLLQQCWPIATVIIAFFIVKLFWFLQVGKATLIYNNLSNQTRPKKISVKNVSIDSALYPSFNSDKFLRLHQ